MDAHEQTITGGRFVTEELAAVGRRTPVRGPPRRRWSRRPAASSPTSSASASSSARRSRGARRSPRSARSEGGGQPEATIIATGKKTLASRAALANGTMALGFEYADFGAGGRPYPFAVTAPLAVAGVARAAGQGPRGRDRDRLRGDGPLIGARPSKPGQPLRRFYVPGAVRHVRRSAAGRRACSGSRPRHELRARARGRVHRRHVPGPRGRRVAALAERRHGRRARRDRGPARRDRLQGDRDGPRGRAGLRGDVLRRPPRRAGSLLDGLGESSLISTGG